MNVENMRFGTIVRFELNGEEIGDYISRNRNVLTQEFIQRLNEVEDYAEAHYKKWNEEFDIRYPGKDGNSSNYVKFISMKMQPYCDEVSRRSKVLEMFVCDDIESCSAGQTIARIKGTNVIMYIDLV